MTAKREIDPGTVFQMRRAGLTFPEIAKRHAKELGRTVSFSVHRIERVYRKEEFRRAGNVSNPCAR